MNTIGRPSHARAAVMLLVVLSWAAPTCAQDTPAEPSPPAAPEKITSVQRQRFWTGLSIGVGWEKVVTTSGHASNPFPYRFLFRTPSRSGWAVTPLFGWFSSDIDASALSQPDTRMGELTVRPILVGVRRTWVRDPLSIDVAAAAGPSFNSFKLAPEARPLAGAGGGAVSADANVSLAWRLQVSTWHDFTEKFALRGALSYAYVQPEITFTSGGVGRRISQNANSVQLGFGAVYRIF